MTKTDSYENLINALNLLPGGFSRTKSGVELKILRKIFSPKEALVASNMSALGETSDVIAERANLSYKETEKILKAMANRGLIWGPESLYFWDAVGNEARKFRLAPYAVGIFEEQVEGLDHELADLITHYWMDGGALGIMSHGPAIHRVIPIQQSVKIDSILPYDDIKPLILKAKFFELRDCICRKSQDILGVRRCNFPIRTCLIFSEIERPMGVQLHNNIGKEEALEVLDQAEEAGLVHQVSNNAKGVYYVCNCCSCCCGPLMSIARLGIGNALAKANYFAVVDPDKCSGCGTCEDRCPMKAISVQKEVAVVDLKRCIGCGLCFTGCPTEAVALKLKPDAEIVHPPETYQDWEQLRLRSRQLIK